jgi:hypothetical protein
MCRRLPSSLTNTREKERRGGEQRSRTVFSRVA